MSVDVIEGEGATLCRHCLQVAGDEETKEHLPRRGSGVEGPADRSSLSRPPMLYCMNKEGLVIKKV